MNIYFWSAPVAALTALIMALYFYYQVKNEEDGDETIMDIAEKIYRGAMAFLKQQSKVVSRVIVVMAMLLVLAAYYQIQSEWTPAAFISGAFFSGLCGFLGMRASTKTAPKVVQAARKSLSKSFRIAFRGGAVMGMLVAGFGLLDITAWFVVLNLFIEGETGLRMMEITNIMITFGVGASVQAIFARLGGGIFTKGADVAADSVGKSDHGWNEDDRRNPAVIADNVGDNVGDVAGMGADLYESYTGSMLATMTLGSAAVTNNDEQQMAMIIFPMLISALGIFASIAGIFMIKILDGDTMKKLVRTMNNSFIVGAFVVFAGAVGVTHLLDLNINLAYCVAIGIGVGVIIGELTNYYTSSAYSPTRKVYEAAEVSDGLVVISGLSVGMISTGLTILTIVFGVWAAYSLGLNANLGTGDGTIYGLYGISIAGVSMLSLVGLTLAADAYGPIADNAGGCAEMAHLPDEVRVRTDILDEAGNTTAAIGKGFAIGSAAMTAMALLASYSEAARMSLIRSGQTLIMINDQTVRTTEASLVDLMNYFGVTLMNNQVIIGLFIGGMIVWVFSGGCLAAVQKVANLLSNEAIEQIEDPAVQSGLKEPDSERCITIATKGSQREMIFPAALGIIPPIIASMLIGVPGVLALLAGAIITGVPMAIFSSNCGGSLDNAKKLREQNGEKNTPAHKRAITGDVVGDPLKDTSGPSINILMKLLALTSIVVVGLTRIF